MRFTLLKFFIFLILLVPTTSVFAAPIKILLVPGHDNQSWGALYGRLKEADMNLELATQIFNILKQDPRFEVYITRDVDGYTGDIANYVAINQQTIIDWRDTAKATRQAHIDSGSFIQKENIQHNIAVEDTSIMLYGINKWVADKNIDVVLHIHFNDYPRKNKWRIGKYKGFAIYYPEEQIAHSKESKLLAESVLTELKKKYTTSTYKPESGGLVADQSLIALGSNGTLSPRMRSILVEYGYIYRFGNPILRKTAYTNMANLTVTGVQNYFFPTLTSL